VNTALQELREWVMKEFAPMSAVPRVELWAKMDALMPKDRETHTVVYEQCAKVFTNVPPESNRKYYEYNVFPEQFPTHPTNKQP